MLAEIETGIIKWLRDHWPEHGGEKTISQFDIGKDFGDINNFPAISAAIETIQPKRNADGSINLSPTISLYLVFKSVARPDQRRAGIYPIVLGVMGLVAGKRIDLDIEPLMPVSADEIYHDQVKKIGALCYRLKFRTDFDCELTNIDNAVDLISIGLTYYDGTTNVVMAQDDISFTEE